MLESILKQCGKSKLVQAVVVSYGLMFPASAIAEPVSSKPVAEKTVSSVPEPETSIYTLAAPQLGMGEQRKNYFGLETKLDQPLIMPFFASSLNDDNRPSYLPPKAQDSESDGQKAYYFDPDKKKSGPKPDYLNPTDSSPSSGSNYSNSSKKSSGCGLTCAIIGGIVTVVGAGLLIGIYGVHKKGEEGNDLESAAIRESESSTGPILIGVGTAGGLGLMIYGLCTLD